MRWPRKKTSLRVGAGQSGCRPPRARVEVREKTDGLGKGECSWLLRTILYTVYESLYPPLNQITAMNLCSSISTMIYLLSSILYSQCEPQNDLYSQPRTLIAGFSGDYIRQYIVYIISDLVACLSISLFIRLHKQPNFHTFKPPMYEPQ